MSLFSVKFVLLIIISLLIYYLIPKNYQWIVLLVTSSIFYLSAGIYGGIFIFLTSFSVYIISYFFLLFDKRTKKLLEDIPKSEKNQRKQIRKENEKKKKILVILGLVGNFLILGLIKYCNPVLAQLGTWISWENEIKLNLVVPLGISFYTFSAIGYLLDVYWEKIEPEKNYFKFLLFLSFFPSIIQGPINRFKEQGTQFFQEHRFDLEEFEKAMLLILWGLFKKLVVANRVIGLQDTIFSGASDYSGGTILLGLLIYSVWQYADFSGGIDIVTGVGELFGIKIAENFRRPYFSHTLSEFWRRWHISLGAWMKDYVLFPLMLSNWAERWRKRLQKIFTDETAGLIVVGIGDIIVFLLVGVWHGAHWHFVLWGLYNGVILAISSVMTPKLQNLATRLRVPIKSKCWMLFQIVRTFIIVNIGWIFDRSETVEEIKLLFDRLFVHFSFRDLSISNILSLGMAPLDLLIWGISLVILFGVSLYEEKGNDIRSRIFNWILPIRWIVLYAFIFFVIYGVTGLDTGAEFLYAQF